MSTVDATSGADRTLRVIRETQHFGTIIVVGGGCYGDYYVRQLGRAAAAGAVLWRDLVVVDRDNSCLVAQRIAAEKPPQMRVEVAEWREYFEGYLSAAVPNPDDVAHDTIVPSPLMPHLMADWLMSRATARWPDRSVSTERLHSAPVVPWERAGDDGTHYVSFADWMCPVNCIEPARCPHTRGARDWSMPTTLNAYAAGEADAARAVTGNYVFHCTHRTHGVGMIDVRDVIAADRAIAQAGTREGQAFLVGTVSHCHGAVRRVVVSAGAIA